MFNNFIFCNYSKKKLHFCNCVPRMDMLTNNCISKGGDKFVKRPIKRGLVLFLENASFFLCFIYFKKAYMEKIDQWKIEKEITRGLWIWIWSLLHTWLDLCVSHKLEKGWDRIFILFVIWMKESDWKCKALSYSLFEIPFIRMRQKNTKRSSSFSKVPKKTREKVGVQFI